MKLVRLNSRENWKSIVEAQGLDYHTTEHQYYWIDDRAYYFQSDEILALEKATYDLQKICLETVETIIKKNQFARLAIPEAFIPTIIDSWNSDDPSLYGRFDLCYDGSGTPKMLEYNADTPTSLLESAVIQWYWLEDQRKNLSQSADQFNFIHEELVKGWKWYGKYCRSSENEVVYFSCISHFSEDRKNVEYIRDCASHAGLSTQFICLRDIGWDGKKFADLDGKQIGHLFKLYPWEILVRERFGIHLTAPPMRLIEPAWKMILSNKALLPLLWEQHEGHPNLLPSYFEPEPLGSTYVKKPIYSREGANITIVREGEVLATQGIYGKEGYIYQQFAPLPEFDKHYPMIGSWIIGGVACGIGIRDSNTLVTDNWSSFVPHYFNNPNLLRVSQ